MLVRPSLLVSMLLDLISALTEEAAGASASYLIVPLNSSKEPVTLLNMCRMVNSTRRMDGSIW